MGGGTLCRGGGREGDWGPMRGLRTDHLNKKLHSMVQTDTQMDIATLRLNRPSGPIQ